MLGCKETYQGRRAQDISLLQDIFKQGSYQSVAGGGEREDGAAHEGSDLLRQQIVKDWCEGTMGDEKREGGLDKKPGGKHNDVVTSAVNNPKSVGNEQGPRKGQRRES